MSAERNVIMQYQRLQLKSERDLQGRIKAAAKIPGVADIQQQINELYSSVLKGGFSDKPAQPIFEKIAKLNADLRALLNAAGYPIDYLEPEYQCRICRDTGYITRDRQRCACFDKKLAGEYAKQWGMPDTGASFERFDESRFNNQEQRAHIIKLKSVCLNYTAAFPKNSKKDMLFVGKAGLGKTFMMMSICKEVAKSGYGVICLTAYRLIEVILSKGFGEEKAEVMHELISCPLLAIDDLGSEPLYNQVTVEVLFNILNERAIRNKHTLVCTNLVLERIQERYGDRIASRLFDKSRTLISLFTGSDLRLT